MLVSLSLRDSQNMMSVLFWDPIISLGEGCANLCCECHVHRRWPQALLTMDGDPAQSDKLGKNAFNKQVYIKYFDLQCIDVLDIISKPNCQSIIVHPFPVTLGSSSK